MTAKATLGSARDWLAWGLAHVAWWHLVFGLVFLAAFLAYELLTAL